MSYASSTAAKCHAFLSLVNAFKCAFTFLNLMPKLGNGVDLDQMFGQRDCYTLAERLVLCG
jgi:hypothetical protein